MPCHQSRTHQIRTGIINGRRHARGLLDPALLSGILAAPSITEMRDNGGLWKDAAKTQPASQAGDSLKRMVCTSTGVEIETPDGQATPTLRQDASGNWYAEYTGGSFSSSVAATFSGNAAESFCLGFAGRYDDAGNRCAMAIGGTRALFILNGKHYVSGGAVQYDFDTTVAPDALDHVHVCRWASNKVIKYLVAPTEYSGVSTNDQQAFTNQKLWMGRRSDGFPLPGRIYAAIWVRNNLTDVQRDEVRDWLQFWLP
jgi:hypothetical protein